MKQLVFFFAIIVGCCLAAADQQFSEHVQKMLKERQQLEVEMHKQRVELIKKDPELLKLHKQIMALHKELSIQVNKKHEMKQLVSKARALEKRIEEAVKKELESRNEE